ncbi:MAG: hypothetical protein KGS61_03485, partial [Verrucomicrobia bacterium]|nr:hypothetical protein [Verrucomicrobiota bacterium]
TATSSITAGAQVNAGSDLVNLTVTGDVAGTVAVTGNLSTATSSATTIGGSVSGTIAVTGNAGTVNVGQDVSGTIQVKGALSQLTVGGSITTTGQVSVGGNLTTLTDSGSILGTVTVGGVLGTLTVKQDLGGTVQTGGDLTQATIDGNLSGTLDVGGNLGSLTVNGDLSGNLGVGGDVGALNIGGSLNSAKVGGNITGNFTVGGTIDQLSVGGSILGKVSIGHDLHTLVIGGNLAGLVQVGGSVTTAAISGNLSGTFSVGGSLGSLTVGQTVSGQVAVGGDLTTLTVTGDVAGAVTVTGNLVTMTVGGNLAGTINVVGKLTTLTVNGNTAGSISAGDIDTIAVYAAQGPIVARITEGGVTRRIEAALPGNPYPNPNDANTPAALQFPSAITFQYFYDSRAAAGITVPELAIRVNNPTTVRFDLSLVVYSDSAQFDLARVDTASGTQAAGIRNLVVEGDLLTGVTAAMATFFGYAASTVGGVRLPADAVTGISIRDFAPPGDIQVASIAGIAFGTTTDEDGRLISGPAAETDNAVGLLVRGVGLVQANDTFRVSFADAHPVAFFLVTDPQGRHFDESNVIFTDQAANDARGAVTALITVVVPVATHGQEDHAQDSVIQSIALRGDGGAIQTEQPVTQSITSTGPLGDLILGAEQGITADVTAPSIIGSIEATSGPISGTIQTTGLRLDPITGLTSGVAADWGRTYWTPARAGGESRDGGSTPTLVLTTTVVEARGGGVTGRLISRGNLVSQITSDGGLSGVVAVQGNLGVQSGTTRLGGVLVNGGLSGQLVVLGNVLGDITLNGGLKSGHIAFAGSDVGNLLVHGGVDKASAIVAIGSIGSAAAGTTSSLDNLQGILAVEGSVNLAKPFNGSKALFDKTNLGSSNANSTVLNAIFTNNGQPLLFDLTSPLDLQGLSLILADLDALHVGTNGYLTGPTP